MNEISNIKLGRNSCSNFIQKDEIADKILFCIEDSFINGEGILAHSFKGQNRVCIVVLINGI